MTILAGTVPAAYVRTARPKQWVKNLLVFAAPASAGVLAEADVFRLAAITFVALCAASSGSYFLNDAADAEADRKHAIKQARPVAAGLISERAAIVAGSILILISIALAFLVSPPTAIVVFLYVALTTSYTFYFKHIVVLDLIVISLGFLLRAIAGGVATQTELSRWFILVVGFGSLFVVAVKRSSERWSVGGSSDTRSVLTQYTDRYLAGVSVVALAATLVTYTLWAFERSDASSSPIPWSELSIIPVLYGLFRYQLLAEHQSIEAPEDVLLGDRSLLVAGMVWVAVFGLGVIQA